MSIVDAQFAIWHIFANTQLPNPSFVCSRTNSMKREISNGNTIQTLWDEIFVIADDEMKKNNDI